MSVRKNQNQVEELRAQIEACAVVARQQAQSIDANPVAYQHYTTQEEYRTWLDNCFELYQDMVKKDIHKNVNCHTWGEAYPFESGYIDCGNDGWRMTKLVDINDDKYKNNDVSRWTLIEGNTPDEKLDALQNVPGAKRIFCSRCKTCYFKSDIAENIIEATFFKRMPSNGTNADPSRFKMSIADINDKIHGTPKRKPDPHFNYTLYLVEHLEYVFIPEFGQGFVFCNIIDSKDTATRHGLQWNGLPYLYVELICAKTGISGRTLLEQVEKFAASLKINRIVLSSLGHVIFYYRDKCKFHFADRYFNEVEIDPQYERTQTPENPNPGPYLIPFSYEQRYHMDNFYKEWKTGYGFPRKRRPGDDDDWDYPNVRLTMTKKAKK